jgi:hypothetical protein
MKSKFILAIVALAILNLPGIGQEPIYKSGASGSVPARDRFVGSWELVSTEYQMKDGSKHPYPELGANGRGYLMYTADGHMCAQLVNPNRPAWKDVGHATAAEKIAAIDGLVAYCGRFEVDETKHMMTHYPETAWQPNFEGTTQPRPYTFRDDLLVFSDKEDREPGALSYAITWRRMKPHGEN